MMWLREGNTFANGTPIQYEVRGLPPGQRALIGYPPYWRVLRITDTAHGEWRGDFDSPEDALAALERELAGAPLHEWKMTVEPNTVQVWRNGHPFAHGHGDGHGDGFEAALLDAWTTLADRGEIEAADWMIRQYRCLFGRDPVRPAR